MRAILLILAFFALVVATSLASPALGTTSHAGAPVRFDSHMSPQERVSAILAANVPNYSPDRVTWYSVPAGSHLLGMVKDGAWRVTVAPGSPQAVTDHDADECNDDVPATLQAYTYYTYEDPEHPTEHTAYESIPTTYPLSANAMWPALRNDASAGGCATYSNPSGGVSFFQFQTAGDYGGDFHLEGTASNYGYGTYDLACAPAGSALVVGVNGEWPNLWQFQNATCAGSESGPTPDAYATWDGWVDNYNTQQGMSTYGLAN
jgi:hypothetical protein